MQDFDSDQIANESGISGDTVTEALDALDAAKQPVDDDLTALAALAGTGLLARTGSGTAAVRSITGAGAVAVSNGNGVAGSPEISVPTQAPEVWAAGADTVPSAISADVLSATIAARAGGVVDSGTFTASSQIDIPLPAGWFEAEIVLRVTAASTSNTAMNLRFTRDAFASVIQGASDYEWGLVSAVPAVAAPLTDRSLAANAGRFIHGASNWGLNTSPRLLAILTLHGFASANSEKTAEVRAKYVASSGNPMIPLDGFVSLVAGNATDPINGIRLFPGAGTITGSWTLILRGRIS